MSETLLRSHTLDEVQDVLTGPIPNMAHSRHKDTRAEWFGATWQDSVDMAINGWLDGVPKIDTTTNPAMHENYRPKPVWDVQGSQVDVATYLSGEPECMVNVARVRRPAPVVRIGVDRVASFNVDEGRIQAIGRSVLVLIESLRLAGVPAEVWACFAVHSNDYSQVMDTRVLVQEPSRPVDVSRLAYWVAHPAALRRSVFRLWEQEDGDTRSRFSFLLGDCYGSVAPNYAQSDFDEWAPGVNSTPGELEEWTRDVVSRRVGVRI